MAAAAKVTVLLIAGPTGEGITRPLTFTQRRCAMVESPISWQVIGKHLGAAGVVTNAALTACLSYR